MCLCFLFFRMHSVHEAQLSGVMRIQYYVRCHPENNHSPIDSSSTSLDDICIAHNKTFLNSTCVNSNVIDSFHEFVVDKFQLHYAIS